MPCPLTSITRTVTVHLEDLTKKSSFWQPHAGASAVSIYCTTLSSGHLFGGKSRNLPIVLPNGQARNDSSGFIIGNRPYCFETFPDYYSAKSDQYLKTMKLTCGIRVPNIFCQNRFISWINLGFKAINTNQVPQEAGEKSCGLCDVDWNRQHQTSAVWQWLFVCSGPLY